MQGSQVSLISLNPLEFLNLFSRPGNSLNLAVFVINPVMSLNPLENMRSIWTFFKVIVLNYFYFPKFPLLMMLRFLPVTHTLWELPRLTIVWINLNKYPHLSTTEAKIFIRMFNLHIKRLKSPWILKFCPWNVLECPWILSWQNPMNPVNVCKFVSQNKLLPLADKVLNIC